MKLSQSLKWLLKPKLCHALVKIETNCAFLTKIYIQNIIDC